MRLVLATLLLATVVGIAPVSEAAAVEGKQARAWTVLIYGAVDNDWERPFLRDVAGIRNGLQGADDVEVILLIDRSPKHSEESQPFGEDFSDTRLYRLTAGELARLDGEPEFAGMTADGSVELDMGDAKTLRSFVRFGKTRFPARHFALFLVSHGEGPYCCPDETDGDSVLYTAELTDVLTDEESVDLLGFDACLMAGAENAYQWRGGDGRFGAGYLVASAAVSSSWPYLDIFSRLRTGAASAPAGGVAQRPPVDPETMTPAAFAGVIVEELRHQIDEGRSGDEGIERDLQTWGAFDLAKIAAARRRLDALASRLYKDDEKQDLLALRGAGLDAKTFVYVWPERGAEATMPFVDLCHLCERIAASDAFAEDIRGLARDAAESAADVVVDSFGFSHYEGFVAGRHGLYVVFPDGDKTGRNGKRYWDRIPWYSPLPVIGVDHAYGRNAWCADDSIPGNGKVETWFELMDAWFDSGEKGGSNGYAW